ncbi:hypothetical protein KI809_03845 [Geobacter pelophilus]|uniref:Archaeal glycosylation protein B peripheral domain-containing protein n=1 Tax=Geoanaerobacter pelophilus TaxID=60036 RepID=A0AAW4L5C7_9BACT|nr:hypothetical protein [Geoanaerobacter pelophilus]MBT0663426.1 hypothetical protein [Geoanaerobacter pelophilus]
MNKERLSLRTILLLCTVCLLGFFLRTACYRNFIQPNGGFCFYSPDPYDHLRRIVLGVKSFPLVPSFDSYAAYPKGLGQIWSPLFDYLLSAFSLIFGGSDTVVEQIGFFANPVLSVATIAATFLIARKSFGNKNAAILAAFVVAASPGHISYTLAPKLDHHVLEPMVILILYSFTFLGTEGRLSVRESLAAISAFPLTILMWRGATLFWAYLFIYLLIRGALESARGNRRCLDDYTKVFLGAAAIIAVICVADPWRTSARFSFNIVSWFHVVALAFCALLLQFLGTSGSVKIFCRRFFFLLALLPTALLFPFVRSFGTEILSGISFIGGTHDSWLESIPEQQFFFVWGFWYGVIGTVTLLWFLIPPAVVLSFREWRQGGFRNGTLLAVAVWGAGMFPLVKLRYSGVMAIPVALASAWLFSWAWVRWHAVLPRIALASLAPILLIPGYKGYVSNVTFTNSPITRVGEYGRSGVFEWIRKNTPQTSYYLNPQREPEYGILAPWRFGAKLYYLAQRPSVTTAFGWEAHGLYEIGGFMATDKLEVAAQIASLNRVRYLLAVPDEFAPYYRLAADGVRKGVLPAETLGTVDGTGSMLQRLATHDGSSYPMGGGYVTASQRYRLVYETPNPADMGAENSFYKVFEVVPGAVIYGRCGAGNAVGLEMPLRTSSGRLLRYTDRAITNEQGEFLFRVPYATDVRQGDTLPLDSYSLSCSGGALRKVSVPEQAIASGLTITR